MKKLLLAAFVLLAPLTAARADAAKIDNKQLLDLSTTAFVKISTGVELSSRPEPVFRHVVQDLTVTAGESSPASFILAGRVLSNNSGGAIEFSPVFFGSTLHLPRLAALTNSRGEFSFRVWIHAQAQHSRLEATDIRQATIYLDGLFNDKADMVSSQAHLYPLALLMPEGAGAKD